jgi:hypothetical protein
LQPLSRDRKRIEQALELTTALVPFWLVSTLWAPFSLPEPLASIFNLALGVIAGLTIPIFFLGKPVIWLEWKIRGDEVQEGNYQLDLARGPQADFIVDARVETDSLLAWVLMRRAVRLGTVVIITLSPDGVLRLKSQSPTGGAKVLARDGEIHIPIGSHGGVQHARASGAFVAGIAIRNPDRVELRHRAATTVDTDKVRWIEVKTPFPQIRVRS